jgi:hypothetical protein
VGPYLLKNHTVDIQLGNKEVCQNAKVNGITYGNTLNTFTDMPQNLVCVFETADGEVMMTD